MTATRAGSPLGSPFRVKFARISDPGLMSRGEEKSIDFLVNVTSTALQLQLKSEAKDMCVKEWVKHGGLDGTLTCVLCGSTPVTYKDGLGAGHRDCEGDCYTCGLDFYTSKGSERTGRTVTLCEFCYEGEWTHFGRRVFEVVKPAQLYLVDCAESIIWSYQQYDGDMFRNALGRGVEMVRRGIRWASVGEEASVTVESALRGRILEQSFDLGEFAGAYRRRLREEGGFVGRKGSGDPHLV
jgi:hypothetical protein